MQQVQNFVMGKDAMGVVKSGEKLFSSLPHLPNGVKEFLATVAPYLALIGAVLTIIGGPILGVLGSFASIMLLSPGLMIYTLINVLIAVISAVALLLAFKPLQERKLYGWALLFWVELLQVVISIISVVVYGGYGIIGTLVGMLIGFYILFEMKPKYS